MTPGSQFSGDDATPAGAAGKPKLALFQFRYGEGVPKFIVRHRDEHVRCLQHSFDVAVIQGDCDFQQVCDTVQPDIVVFESGVNQTHCTRPIIRNVRGYGAIPRVGFHNADGWCETRSGILADMDEWGIDTFFSIAVTAAEHTPHIAKHLFVWPTFIEGDVFRDYGIPKIAPILITGSQDPQYPWRHKVYPLLTRQFPSLICPHGGYNSLSATRQMMFGVPYARAINASSFAPACGTVAKETVRKHFEIPGCKTCMITEDSPGLRAAGFEDMKNCVFADEHDAADKVAYLLDHPDELERISEAGYALVHSRHTSEHRDQVHQWFVLHKQLQPDQHIVQPNPFEPLEAVANGTGDRPSYVVSNGLHLQLLRKGDAALKAGDYKEAERCYADCSRYMGMLPEAKLKLAVCDLHQGRPQAAIRRLLKPIRYTLLGYRAAAPDPVEWAYFILGLLCAGRLREAARRARQFGALQHVELQRARWVVDVLTHRTEFEPRPIGTSRLSIHQLPERPFGDWVRDVADMFTACGKVSFVRLLQEALAQTTDADDQTTPGRLRAGLSWRGTLAKLRRLPFGNWRFELGVQRWIDSQFLGERLRDKAGRVKANISRALMTRGRVGERLNR